MNTRISIIILNWNGLSDTIECLESVRKIDYPNYEVIVVDNGSTDGSSEQIRKLFPEVTLIQNRENLGFAEGNNVGIRYALENGAEYVFLLNNDTIVDAQILRHFIEAAEKYPEAGIFGAKIYYYSDLKRIWFAGGQHKENSLFLRHKGLNKIDDNESYSQIQEIDYTCGCGLFFRDTVAKKIGLLNPSFFAYYEDADWCFRGRRAGFKCLYIPEAKVWHKISVSFGGDGSPFCAYYGTRNYLLWASINLLASQKLGVIKSIFEKFFPSTFDCEQRYPLAKRIYWDIIDIFKNYSIFEAKLIGLKDYFLKCFGKCPVRIYDLNEKYSKSKKD